MIFIVLVRLKKLKVFERVNQTRFLITHKIHEIVVMMYWKSLKVEMAGFILGSCVKYCLWVISYNFRYTTVMINFEVISDIFKYVRFVHRNRVKWQQICWTVCLCFVRPAQNFIFSSYAHEVVLQITLLLTVMEVKQLNQWNKLLFIIPHRIMLHSLKIWLLCLSLSVLWSLTTTMLKYLSVRCFPIIGTALHGIVLCLKFPRPLSLSLR